MMRINSALALSLCACATLGLSGLGANAAVTPAIKLTNTNAVPACITPARLMMYVRKRNRALPKRFNSLAALYKKHGEEIDVRWDYAFFQMIVETNWLKFRTGSGRPGLVRANQNNFAGLGATGPGVRGEFFKTVSDGVLGHLQHIKMYSGVLIDDPKAERTRKVQGWLIDKMRANEGVAVTFTDLTRRWSPNDKGYSNDIETVAANFRRQFCGPDVGQTASIPDDRERDLAAARKRDSERATAAVAPDTSQAATNAVAREGEGQVENVNTNDGKRRAACQVWTASYGGSKSLLIKSVSPEKVVNYTALGVHDGMESQQAEAYIKAWAQGGKPIGEFSSHTEALTQAYQLCPAS